jgi:hypothetical protein
LVGVQKRLQQASSGGGKEREARGKKKEEQKKRRTVITKKRKGEKKKKGKKKRESSVSSEEESSSSDSCVEEKKESSGSSTDSSEDSTEGSSSEEGGKKRKRKSGERKKGKKSKKEDKDWELMEELWPAEDRPRRLQDREYVMGVYSVSKLMRLKDQFEKETAKKGIGSAVFGKDKKPKSVKFKKMKDDGEMQLHPARFVSLPRVDPAKFWDQVPVGWSEVYRHVPLQHVGAENVPEGTIVKMHNRKVPVELAMLRKESISEVVHVEEAVLNYVAVLRHLHPADYGGLVLHRVMAEAGWGGAMNSNVKDRVALLRKFFDEAVRENSGRAVRQEPPLTCEQARGRWARAMAAVCPQLAAFGVGGGQVLMLGGPGKQNTNRFGNGGFGGGGGVGKGSGAGGSGGAAGSGGGGVAAAGAARGVGSVSRTPARFNGLPVCFGFNSKGGCRRAAPGASLCKDGSSSFAHVCNLFIKGTGGKPDSHCLGAHSRASNH